MSSFMRTHGINATLELLFTLCIHKGINYQIERFILDHHMNKEAILEEKASLFSLYSDLIERAPDALSPVMEDLKFYFASPVEGEVFAPLYELVLCWRPVLFYHFTSISDIRDYLLGMDNETFCKGFLAILSSYNNTIITGEEGLVEQPDAVDITSYILGMEIPDSLKLKLQDIFFHHDKHIEKILSVLEHAYAFFLTKEAEIQREVDAFYAYWENVRGTRSMYRFITEELPYFRSIEESKSGYELYPCFVPHSFMLIFDEDTTGIPPSAKPAVSIGLLYGEHASFKELYNVLTGETDDDSCIEALKLISDKSRFEILSYLNQNGAYSSQIASHLGLTTATVSHHMGSLFQAGLVCHHQDAGDNYDGDAFDVKGEE